MIVYIEREARCQFCGWWLPCGPERKPSAGHGRLDQIFTGLCQGRPKGPARYRIHVRETPHKWRRPRADELEAWTEELQEGLKEAKKTRAAHTRLELPDVA